MKTNDFSRADRRILSTIAVTGSSFAQSLAWTDFEPSRTTCRAPAANSAKAMHATKPPAPRLPQLCPSPAATRAAKKVIECNEKKVATTPARPTTIVAQAISLFTKNVPTRHSTADTMNRVQPSQLRYVDASDEMPVPSNSLCVADR